MADRINSVMPQQAVMVGTFKVSYSFTRPADTTAYAVNDAISNATSSPTQISFTVTAGGYQSIVIRKAILISSRTTTTIVNANLYLFGETAASATFNDNSALDIPQAIYEGGGAVVPLVEVSNVSSRSRAAATSIYIPMLTDQDGKIYGVLQALNAYTPASGEKFTVIIYGELS